MNVFLLFFLIAFSNARYIENENSIEFLDFDYDYGETEEFLDFDFDEDQPIFEMVEPKKEKTFLGM